MTATTENRDGSGAVLIEEIRRLDDRVDHFREAYQTLQQRVNVLAEAFAALQPCPEFPPELLSIGTGPARVNLTSATTLGDLQDQVNSLLEQIENEGSVVESVQYDQSQNEFDQGPTYSVCIVYREPAPATEAPR